MFRERTSKGGEEGDGKNLHFQQSHVNAMRFLAPPAHSSTRPPWQRERMLQALTLVRQLQCGRVAAKKLGYSTLIEPLWIAAVQASMRAV
jgi:hypothetical protein